MPNSRGHFDNIDRFGNNTGSVYDPTNDVLGSVGLGGNTPAGGFQDPRSGGSDPFVDTGSYSESLRFNPFGPGHNNPTFATSGSANPFNRNNRVGIGSLPGALRNQFIGAGYSGSGMIRPGDINQRSSLYQPFNDWWESRFDRDPINTRKSNFAWVPWNRPSAPPQFKGDPGVGGSTPTGNTGTQGVGSNILPPFGQLPWQRFKPITGGLG